MDSKVEQFKAITGAPSKLAKTLLEACGGNLELAVNMHMEGGGSSVPPVATQGHSSGSAIEHEPTSNEILSPTSYKAIHGVRAPIPQSSGVLIEETPPRVMQHSRRLPQTVFDPFQDFQNTGRFGRGVNADKKRSLAQLFKPPHDILFRGTFHEAKLTGQRCKKWLLINLQDSKEFLSQVLNRDVWSNHNVKDIIRQHFLFWQVYCITDEGIKFKQLYHVTSCPYIAIIDPMTGEKLADWSSLTVSAFTDSALEFISNHHYTSDLPSGSETHDSMADKSEESQLEAAIQASIKEAQVSAKKQQVLVFSDDSDIDCVSLISSEGEETLDTGDVMYTGNSSGGTSTQTRLLDVEYHGTCNGSVVSGATGNSRKRPSWRRDDEMCDELPRKMMRADISGSVERDGMSESGAVSCSDLYLILFRLPDGTRIQHKFISSCPIKEMFAFLESKGIGKAEHEIITQFPRRNLSHVDSMATLRDLGLHRRETIFIHTID